MKRFYVHFENCHGISSFTKTFEFDSTDSKAHLIYAPNGMMKTSFANTLSDIVLERETKDHFYPDRVTIRYVKTDSENGKDIDKKSILVIQPYFEDYRSENMSVLLADDVLKREYESIHSEIREKMNSVFSQLNSLSNKRSSEGILVKDFGFSENDIYRCLETIYDMINGNIQTDYSMVKYGKLITADSEKIFSDREFILLINAYIEQYERLLTQSSIFKSTFNHNNAEDVLRTLSKEGFFKAKHKVVLADTADSIGENDFKKAIEDEKKRILDTELSDEFKKIDELLSAKAGTKALRDYIIDNKSILPELSDIEQFKKKIWISYLQKNFAIFQEAVVNYRNNKLRLEDIARRAREQMTKWNRVVSLFNERFSNMPFSLQIKNKDDVILKSKLPSIGFTYKSQGVETLVEEKDLLQHLSNGEKKALYLLNIIFEIQARRENRQETLLIMDDVADSFDYRNKYAIIEYIKDVSEYGGFYPIILTHNFDFYRTVAGRIGIRKASSFVIKSDTEIRLEQGQYFENVFMAWRSQVESSNAVFISSIAFVRNLIEYSRGCNDNVYKQLTCLLHYKKAGIDGCIPTNQITNEHLSLIYQQEWSNALTNFRQTKAQTVIELLFMSADNLKQNCGNLVIIENKIVMSIAIRLRAEQYMINRINDDVYVNSICGNQTRLLRDKIVFNHADHEDQQRKDVIERVLIITSENIHINSFMYEPIVDMSLEELIRLYVDVCRLLPV